MRTILVADENADIRESISLMFSDCMGYRVATASSGADAIIKAKKIKPDIVLADVSLSDKDGYELSREIKDNPLLKDTPVILLFSSLEAFDEEKAADALADDFMIKPFNPEETIKKVESLIRQREKEDDVMGERKPEQLKTIHLSIKNQENRYELTEESAQDLKMAIRMTAKRTRELRTIPNRIPVEAGYLKAHLYRRRYLVALTSISTVLLVITMFTFHNTLKRLQQVEDEIKTYEAMGPKTGENKKENEEKAALRVLGISVSDNGSTQSRLNLGSWTLSPDGRSGGNIVSKEIKGNTPLHNGKTQRISKRKTRGSRHHVRSLLASNIWGKESPEQLKVDLERANLLYKP
jgi:DNA-binding response OmpR family regulator